MANNVHVIDHPLVAHHLTRLRNKETPSGEFRRLVKRLSTLLSYEATQCLELQDCEVETPLELTTGKRLKGRIGIVPILRAGLGMVDPILDLIPTAEIWHLGFYRDEATAQPVEYYKKLPDHQPVHTAMVVDPMLATGGSAIAALKAIEDWGVPNMALLVLIASPEGIAAVQKEFPNLPIFTCSIDRELDSRSYILPGLGDAGDRIYNAAAHS